MTQDPFIDPRCFVEVPDEDLNDDNSSKDNLCWGRLKGGRRCTNRTRVASFDTNVSAIGMS